MWQQHSFCAYMPMVVDTGLNGRLLGEEAAVETHSSVHGDPLATQPDSPGGSPPLSPQRQPHGNPKPRRALLVEVCSPAKDLSSCQKIDAASKTRGNSLARRPFSVSKKDEGHSGFSLL